MTTEDYQRLESALRDLDAPAQRRIAIALASLVEPLAALSPAGQPPGGLPAAAHRLRETDSRDLADLDNARRLLCQTPELRDDDEPEGLAWFSFGSTVAWMYAADALATAPADGAVHAWQRVAELIDALAEDAGATALPGSFDEAMRAAVRNNAPDRISALAPAVRAAAELLAAPPGPPRPTRPGSCRC